jgi:ABC-type transport system involved in multi-copper enzyme maturation permease subunit
LELWKELVVENPMIEEGRREFRHFIRNSTAMGPFIPLIISLVVGFLYLWFLGMNAIYDVDSIQPFLFIQLIVLSLVAIASMYPAISGEREKETFDALILTRLTPAQIVAGKFLWRLRYIALLSLFFIAPILVSVIRSYFMGDPTSKTMLTLDRLIRGEALMLGWFALLSAFSLWVSTLVKRSITALIAIILSNAVVLLIVPAVVSLIYSAFFNSTEISSDIILSFHPFVSLSGVFGNASPSGSNPITDSGYWQFFVYSILAAFYIYCGHGRLKTLRVPVKRAQQTRSGK